MFVVSNCPTFMLTGSVLGRDAACLLGPPLQCNASESFAPPAASITSHRGMQVTSTAAFTGTPQTATLQAAWTVCGVLLGVAETSFALQLPAPASIVSFTASAATITRCDLCCFTLPPPSRIMECLIKRSLSCQMAMGRACLESCCALGKQADVSCSSEAAIRMQQQAWSEPIGSSAAGHHRSLAPVMQACQARDMLQQPEWAITRPWHEHAQHGWSLENAQSMPYLAY